MIILLLIMGVISFAIGVVVGPKIHAFIKMAQNECCADLKRGEATLPKPEKTLIRPDEFWGSPKPKKARKSKRKK